MPAPLEATMFAIVPGKPEIGDMSAKVWPHISVVPWVQLGADHHEVICEVRDIVEGFGPIELKPGPMTRVGAEGYEKKAQRIRSEQLKDLHIKLLYSLGGFGVLVSHPEWAGRNYSPHITSENPVLLMPTTVTQVHVIDNLRLGSDEKGTKVVTQILESHET